jgi:tRNA C32,U32 (ribose-2'-O)-methylase TrmJ
MKKWNYRVMRHTDAVGRTHYAIHEAYYNDVGEVTAWTNEPSAPFGETIEELREELERMLRALDYPVIEVPHGSGNDGCGND